MNKSEKCQDSGHMGVVKIAMLKVLMSRKTFSLK